MRNLILALALALFLGGCCGAEVANVEITQNGETIQKIDKVASWDVEDNGETLLITFYSGDMKMKGDVISTIHLPTNQRWEITKR